MDICLIVPGPLATVSGGHHYDRRMAEGLRALGHEVRVAELDGRLPDPDQASIYAARTVWAALPDDTVKLIDGLALPAFAGLPLHRVTALIHHPASLETGVPEETRQRLQVTEAAMLAAVPRLVTTSEQTAERLVRDFGASQERMSVIIPGIDDLPRSRGSAGPACQILSVGALIPRKGHDVLLRALGRLFDLEWELTIAGSTDRDPVHVNGLRALAEALGVTRRVRVRRCGHRGALGGRRPVRADLVFRGIWRGDRRGAAPWIAGRGYQCRRGADVGRARGRGGLCDRRYRANVESAAPADL